MPEPYQTGPKSTAIETMTRRAWLVGGCSVAVLAGLWWTNGGSAGDGPFEIVKSEDEWFRAALSKSVVLQMSGGVSRPIPIDFFFPEDARNPDFIAGSASGKLSAPEKPASKEEHKR